MKYATFVRIRAAAIAAIVIMPVAAWLGCQKSESPQRTPVVEAPAITQNNSPAQSAPAENAPNNAPSGNTMDFTEVHRAIIRLQKEPLSTGQEKGGSIKWVYKDAGIRAEFRCDKDKGFNYWNRVKIDYNGNKNDDERWDFKKDGTVKRRVSPQDDGNYTEEYVLNGEKWVKK